MAAVTSRLIKTLGEVALFLEIQQCITMKCHQLLQIFIFNVAVFGYTKWNNLGLIGGLKHVFSYRIAGKYMCKIENATTR